MLLFRMHITTLKLKLCVKQILVVTDTMGCYLLLSKD